MAKKRLHEKSYREAVEYARKFPSQIANMREILSELEQELGRPDFEIRGALYSLLSGAMTQAKRDAVLRSYQQGLNEVDQEGRFELRHVWQVPFEDEWISGTHLDGPNDQVIVTTSPGKSKKASIYALRLENGKQRWVHRMKKNYAARQPCLDQNLLFFTTSYCGGGELSYHMPSPLCAISLETGELAWRWALKKDEWGGVERVCGLFKNLVLVGTEENNLVAFDAVMGEERWRHHPSYCRIKQELFLALGDILRLQYRDREIGWFSEDGTLVKKRALRFPKRKRGFIDRVYTSENDDVIYLCLWGTWNIYNKRNPKMPGRLKSQSIVYAVGKCDAKIKWSFRPRASGARFRLILLQGDMLYLCGEGIAFVVERETGKVIREWQHQIYHVTDKLLFHTDKVESWYGAPFTFYARDARTGKVQWQRKSFELLGAEGDLLFGKVGSMLVVLDEKNGKERASISLESEPRGVVLVDRGSFLAVDAERKVLSLFELSGEA